MLWVEPTPRTQGRSGSVEQPADNLRGQGYYEVKATHVDLHADRNVIVASPVHRQNQAGLSFFSARVISRVVYTQAQFSRQLFNIGSQPFLVIVLVGIVIQFCNALLLNIPD